MRAQEVRCFARALGCDLERIEVIDLIGGVPSAGQVDGSDIVLLGGSGDYSVATGGPWLAAALEAMASLHDRRKPTFASCWGFQAMAAALGGEVITDLERAELGTIEAQLTEAGAADAVFGGLPQRFDVQIGHQDLVTRLPEHATLLAETDRAPQAFRFDDAPIYCTQFHPELDRAALIERLEAYPMYVEVIAGMSLEQFCAQRTREAPAAGTLLKRFVETVMV